MLLVGLGNPGTEYAKTRHNIGFMAVDEIVRRYSFPSFKEKGKGALSVGEIDNRKVFVLKPHTFMNLSGEAVQQAVRFYRIPPEHVLVISDDISLPIGKLRIRAGGSAGGHNGLKNIIAHLGSDRFPRIKVGVGMPENADYDIADWVTGRPMGDEQKPLMEALDRAVAAVPAVIRDGVDRAQNRFN